MLDRERLRTFLLGGAAGVLAGILLAPRSGRELRGSIANRAGEARERSRESYFEAQERMRERISAVRERGERSEEEIAPERGHGQPAEQPPPLRDVSGEVSDTSRGVPEERSEELRRRIQETRSRLRAHLDGPSEERRDG
jgi:gas vesicle protein